MVYTRIIIVWMSFLLWSCGGGKVYDVGVYNNTAHTPVEIKIQYPSSEGIKPIRFSMINVGEFKSNQLNTRANPVPAGAKISWKNSKGQYMEEIVDLSGFSEPSDQSAIIFNIDESSASVEYLDTQEFAGEWQKRLARKGYP